MTPGNWIFTLILVYFLFYGEPDVFDMLHTFVINYLSKL